MRTVIYPGSFDPVTNGHLDVVRRSLAIFDRVVVAVFDAPSNKTVLFNGQERVALIKEALTAIGVADRVDAELFAGLLVDYLSKKNVRFVVRGLRAMSDFDREFQMAIVNKKLLPDAETVFIVTDKQYFYLNSTLVKELAKHDAELNDMVPKNVERALREKFAA